MIRPMCFTERDKSKINEHFAYNYDNCIFCCFHAVFGRCDCGVSTQVIVWNRCPGVSRAGKMIFGSGKTDDATPILIDRTRMRSLHVHGRTVRCNAPL